MTVRQEGTELERKRTRPPRARARVWRETTVLAIIATLLTIVALMVLRPLAASLVLAAWGAKLARPLADRLSRALGGRRGIAAGLLTLALVVFFIVPTVVVVVGAVPAARSLVAQLQHAHDSRYALESLVTEDGTPTPTRDLDYFVSLGKDFGATAAKVLGIVGSLSLSVIVGLVTLLATFFAFVAEGERAAAWFEANAPVGPAIYRRLAAAFHQAGRGVLVGFGLTALAQGALATVLYLVLGIPRAGLLGVLSTVAALIPLTGPIFVWAPVAAGLAIHGDTGKALTLALFGYFVVGVVDHVLRPVLSRRANLGLSTPAVLVSLLGGVYAFGPWGIVFGPLAIRVAVEALELAREHSAFGRRPPRMDRLAEGAA
ncbi:Putative membrane protein [Labilithrix luteola]|uniref:Putative membrane protein n=2 Tax=Labilithrix luteola TaxID=1391654 RepID=A0A0K1QF89_9BACT|nr:Putative membrane protein [Labilithrix luteola]